MLNVERVEAETTLLEAAATDAADAACAGAKTVSTAPHTKVDLIGMFDGQDVQEG